MYINDTAPVDRWDADILTDGGYSHFMNVVSVYLPLLYCEVSLSVYPFLELADTLDNYGTRIHDDAMCLGENSCQPIQ